MAAPVVICGFELAAFLVCFTFAAHFVNNAVKNNTGPKFENGLRIHNYSGIFENDTASAFINFVTALSHWGALLERIDKIEVWDDFFVVPNLEADGQEIPNTFFDLFRFGFYLLSCPVIVWELYYCSGAPYRVGTSALTFCTLLIAVLADVVGYAGPAQRWGFLALGGVLCACLFKGMFTQARRTWKMAVSLSHAKEGDTVMGIEEDRKITREMILGLTRTGKWYFAFGIGVTMVVWPLFPLMFILEHSNTIHRSDANVCFVLLDILAKTAHSAFITKYKACLLARLRPFGFYSPDILAKINEQQPVEQQLVDLMDAGTSGSHGGHAIHFVDRHMDSIIDTALTKPTKRRGTVGLTALSPKSPHSAADRDSVGSFLRSSKARKPPSIDVQAAAMPLPQNPWDSRGEHGTIQLDKDQWQKSPFFDSKMANRHVIYDQGVITTADWMPIPKTSNLDSA